MIAVLGASGNVGSKLTQSLLGLGERVRVFGRSQERLEVLAASGADAVTGDIRNLEDLQVLFKGADAAMVILPDDVTDPQFVANRSQMSKVIPQSLQEHSVGHVVAISSVGADRDDAPGPVAGLREFEQMLSQLEGINLVILRSAWRMENLLAALPVIQAEKINGSAIKGDVKIAMIASRDVAIEAADRLHLRDFSGQQVKTLLGPEDLSLIEATKVLGSHLGIPELPYVQFPPEGVKNALMGVGMSEEAAALLVELQIAISEGRTDPGPRTKEATTSTTLDGFLKEALRK